MNTYSSYKDSGVEWIGEVPSEWECLRGRFLFENKKIINKEFQCENLLSLTLFGVLNKNMESHKGLRPSNYKTYQLFEKDDLVFKLIDLENVKTSRVGLVHENGIMSPVYIRLEPNKNSHSKYNYYYFYDLYKKEIFNFLGSGVRSSLSPSDLLEIEVPVPPLQEQQQISDYLDYKTLKIDTLIEKTQQKIELLKEQRTSLINTTVTKGLNPNVEMKDSRVEWIGEIPSEWEVVKLKFVGKVVIGLSYSPDNVVDEGEGTLVMRSTNVQNGKPSFHNNVYVNKDIPDRMVTREGDILICSRNGSRNLIGKNCIISKDIEGMTFGVFMTIFRSKYWKLIYWVLNSPVFKSQSGLYLTSTINQLTVSTIKNLTIPFTFNEREQQQIVDYLDKETSRIDKLVDIESKRIYLLKEYRQSLISEVVTGKVDVRDEVLV